MSKSFLRILLLCLVPLLPGCAHHRTHVVTTRTVPVPPPDPEVVVQAPPAPPAEVITPAPGAAYAWVPGYWSWQGRWIWVRGGWVITPRPRAVWVPGRWKHVHHGYVWTPGHWR
ncbi:MAG TPA: hypothetical protein VHI52_12600 [Verrucomicrobiae bacterium]|nr:hypothetical protein [Verrucomicrobiae bacterium]